ncbi:thymidine phosphorylase [Aestuariivirga litoralis]|uniref:thymidine phosphorylase n=1 Tax=Aestuariivirga litoralis TaxID=2650924 RepID=UPI0018C45EBB|nr:thymidine phosphorylase [Aestuariivirga litoralis]MBG1232870.1 thymidine phosphorylase [Aestuariivirga litoralis]
MLPQEVIRAKRDGRALSSAQVKEFIEGLTSGAVTEGQVAAFAMAVFFKGMSADEAVGLTLAMRDSGTVLQWDLPGPVVDKHSSGGIGDNISLMLAPMLSACGCYVPMISGRGLGHTGGTLDKLDSITGYNTTPDNALFSWVTREVGCAIIGQTSDLAPADKRLYGIRDVTATVESVPLITASILSKKLAAGLQHLVMDVKCGSGAFMAKREDAQALAKSLVSVANGAGLKTTALITDMDEPLAKVAGNALEVLHAVRFLKNELTDSRVHEVTVRLGMEILQSTGLATSEDEARKSLEEALASGEAAEIFGEMVAALGGPTGFMDAPEQHVRAAAFVKPVFADDNGAVTSIATRELGLAVIELGGGRRRADDVIDHAVGLDHLLGKGFAVDGNTPLAMIHAKDEADYEKAAAIVKAAYVIGDTPTDYSPILERIAP